MTPYAMFGVILVGTAAVRRTRPPIEQVRRHGPGSRWRSASLPPAPACGGHCSIGSGRGTQRLGRSSVRAHGAVWRCRRCPRWTAGRGCTWPPRSVTTGSGHASSWRPSTRSRPDNRPARRLARRVRLRRVRDAPRAAGAPGAGDGARRAARRTPARRSWRWPATRSASRPVRGCRFTTWRRRGGTS